MTETRCGIVALLGEPNAGKSTLTNALVGEKVSIVTHKVQTTRTRVLGIAMHEQTQIIILDTPGIFDAKKKLDRAMVDAAYDAAGDADMRFFMVDVNRPVNEAWLTQHLETIKMPFCVVLNKVDIASHENVLKVASLCANPRVDRVFMISALKNDGVLDLKNYLASNFPPSPFLYPEDDITDVPQRMYAAEVTREQVILNLHQELPYDTYVETEAFEDFNNGDVKISQVIVVDKDSQKAIVLGHKGERIKIIRERAQRELTRSMERKVHLFLFVKVIPGWKDKSDFYRLMGLRT